MPILTHGNHGPRKSVSLTDSFFYIACEEGLLLSVPRRRDRYPRALVQGTIAHQRQLLHVTKVS